jgi:hypothetical protein
MLNEKDRKLKSYMVSAGMQPGAYWLSWTLFAVALNTYITVVITGICKYGLRIELFENVPIALFLMFFFSCALGQTALGFLLTALCTNKKTGLTVAYAFLLASFVFQVFLTNPNSMLLLFGTQVPVLVFFVKIFVFYPGFNYVKIWAD